MSISMLYIAIITSRYRNNSQFCSGGEHAGEDFISVQLIVFESKYGLVDLKICRFRPNRPLASYNCVKYWPMITKRASSHERSMRGTHQFLQLSSTTLIWKTRRGSPPPQTTHTLFNRGWRNGLCWWS